MKPDTVLHSAIGVGGTTLALITSERVAMLAGLSTAAWMLWQLGCSIWDRARARRSGPVNFPRK